jgi:phytoene synthase
VSSEQEIAQAYAHCEALTRAEAANFFYGIRLLARDRRRAICAVYAFARRVDDIGDGELAHEQKLSLLDAEEAALAAVESPGAGRPVSADPVMVALADAYRRFPLPHGALGELIEGVRMDVAGATYERFEELVRYCRCVAGAIGRVCLAIFGLRDEAGVDRAEAERLADELGVAMQLTNILRDVREDAENGRVYLPAEDLRRFGLLSPGEERSDPAALAALARTGGSGGKSAGGGQHAVGTDGARGASVEAGGGERGLPALVRFEADRAREWFGRGMALTQLLDRRSAASVLAMAGIYRRLLERIAADPEQAVQRRMSLPAREKAWVAARGMIGGGT